MDDAPGRDRLAGLGPGVIALVEVPGESYMDGLVGLVTDLLGDGSAGIVVNASRPYRTLTEAFRGRGVDLDRLYFVDCISRLVKADAEETDRAIFLDSPTMLEMIAMGVDHYMDEAAPGGFVLFDSYGTLVTYNNFQLVYEFTNFLANKLRLRDLRGVLVVVEGELPEQVHGSLAQLSDKVIRWRDADA